jgi:hypothetical protein
MDENKTFYLLDLDRTLLDTVKLTEHLFQIVSQHDAQIATELTEKAEQDYLRGAPFAAREEIEARLGAETTDEIERQLLANEQHEQLLLPGALRMIEFARPNAGILTYGELRGQTMKLKAVRLETLPHLITSHRAKGELISMWHQADGRYRLPVEFGSASVQQVVLVDDRLISFQGIPAQARGYWVTQKPPTTAEISVVPANVVIVRSLHEVIEAES